MATTSSEIVGDPTTYQQSFVAPGVVSDFHGLARFGNTDQFSVLFSGSSEEQEDYVKGLLFIGLLAMWLFALWGLILLIFKYLGRSRVGFLAGQPFPEGTSRSRKEYIRYTYLASACMVLLFTILLATKGTSQLQTASDTFESSNQEILLVSRRLSTISTDLQSTANEAILIRDELAEFLKQDICPNQPGTGAEQTIRDLAEGTLVAIEDLESFVQSDLQQLDGVLVDVVNAAEEIDSAFEESSPTPFQVNAIIIPYIIVTTLMLVVLALGWSGYANQQAFCLVHWLLLPLFIILVILAVVGAAGAAFVAEANADVCSGGQANSPEATIEAIMETEFARSDFEFEVISFYLNQCNSENPLTFLDGYIQELGAASENVDAFLADLESLTVDSISAECGVDFSRPFNLLKPLSGFVVDLLANANEGIEQIGCPNLVPIYRNVIHDATCTSSMQAESWIFSSFLVIAFFGMIMIMTRTAYQPIEILHKSETDLAETWEASEHGSSTHSSKGGSPKNGGGSVAANEAWNDELRASHSSHSIIADPQGKEIEVTSF